MLGRRFVLLSGVLVALIGVAACSNGGAAGTASPSAAPSVAASPSSAPSGSAAPTDTAEPSESSTEIEIKVATGTVGSFLTGADGMTLYTFTADTKDSGKSACNGDCATNWPPLTVASADELKAGDGVNGALTTITRDDGKLQAAYNGMPLYYYAADTKAGDTNGDGVGGKWFVAKP
jgi:predicted lipoprotein with Yx(FWY)xxD motif